jgi:RNA polymerase sigma-70 factor (ECF subfamily)
MSDPRNFTELLDRVKAGDEEACRELVHQYEPAVRRLVRFRLDRRLRRLLDSLDICQSVMGSFFAQAALGRYRLETPAQLLNLLLGITRNKVLAQACRQQAQCRDHRRIEGDGLDDEALIASGPGPDRQVAAQELCARVRTRLSPDEWRLVELRQEGWAWAEIAAEMGGSADALRMKFARAVQRVSSELNPEEVAHA